MPHRNNKPSKETSTLKLKQLIVSLPIGNTCKQAQRTSQKLFPTEARFNINFQYFLLRSS